MIDSQSNASKIHNVQQQDGLQPAANKLNCGYMTYYEYTIAKYN